MWSMTTAYAVGAAVLLTRVQPRYLYFGVMFTAAALPWMPRVGGGAGLGVLNTVTLLVLVWGAWRVRRAKPSLRMPIGPRALDAAGQSQQR